MKIMDPPLNSVENQQKLRCEDILFVQAFPECPKTVVNVIFSVLIYFACNWNVMYLKSEPYNL